jgi:hypothetical protein
MISEADRDLLRRRRRALRHLDVFTWALPVLWLVVGAGVCLRFPALLDPTLAADVLSRGRTADWALLRALAHMAPLLFLVLLALVTTTLAWFLSLLHRERRLLALVERLEREARAIPDADD